MSQNRKTCHKLEGHCQSGVRETESRDRVVTCDSKTICCVICLLSPVTLCAKILQLANKNPPVGAHKWYNEQPRNVHVVFISIVKWPVSMYRTVL